MMSLTRIFEEDADALQVSDELVTGIAGLARSAKLLEKEIEDLEKTLSEKTEQYRKLTEQAIPEALAESGMKSFVMGDGSSISIRPFYGASIPKTRQAEAFQWLRDHGFDDLIKNTVSVRFGRNEDELCTGLMQSLQQQGFPVEQNQKIEPQTLKAWAKERIEKGQPIDTELFGVYIGQKAIIKSV
jgi:hypothetical protein